MLVGVRVMGSVNGVGDLVSSTGLGILWTAVSPTVAFAVAASLMAFGTAMMARDPKRAWVFVSTSPDAPDLHLPAAT